MTAPLGNRAAKPGVPGLVRAGAQWVNEVRNDGLTSRPHGVKSITVGVPTSSIVPLP